MKTLALDLSTKTGWALFDGAQLVSFGNLTLPKSVKDYGNYPLGWLDAINEMTQCVVNVVTTTKPDIIIIEETNLGRNRYSQKILEFLHYSILLWLKCNTVTPIKYVSTSSWRKALQLFLTKDDKKNNTKVNRANREGLSKKELGLSGKVTQKHLSVRFVNALFKLELKLKDNDIADAVCLGWAYQTAPNILLCNGE
jgi:Holliday junction resolvasome RuvABC endonuclease subunit